VTSELARDLSLAIDPARILVAAGLEPDGWQRDFLRKQPQRALLLCARQTGKSSTMAAAALHVAISQPDALVLLVSPTQRQSNILLRRVRRLLPAARATPRSVSESAIELGNGARIVALPGSPEGIRGFSAPALIVVDEAAFVDVELFDAVMPMLATADRGRLAAVSTPRGARGRFWELWTSDEPWERYRVTAVDCPRIPPSFLAEARRLMTQASFSSEYECVFVSPNSAVFAADDVHAALDDTLDSLAPGPW
jgi:hypothetical protein